MYEAFYGLRERPFDLTPNPRFLVLTPKHREALSNLYFGIASGKGVTVLIGEAGTGKTTLLRTVLEAQPQADTLCVHINNPTLTRAEFVELLARGFGLSDEARISKAAMLTELHQVLVERHDAGRPTVIVIDEAQSLPRELLEEVRLLANLETAEHKLVSVVLAGQPELATRLNETGLRQLKQRIALRCELAPLSLAETESYVARRLTIAGGDAKSTFTRDAVALVYKASGGIPRLVSVICDNALVSGFALGERQITRQIIAEVCRDFDLGSSRVPEPAQANSTEQPAAVPAVAPPANTAAPAELSPGDTPSIPSWFGLLRRRRVS
jgi:general secretion pathway protein A